jgi:hypothetical protein
VRGAANPARGEAVIRLGTRTIAIRPSFGALVAAEEETGPLLALVDRAADGRLTLREIEALLWHCRAGPADDLAREAFGAALLAAGIGAAMPALRAILRQIVAGGA